MDQADDGNRSTDEIRQFVHSMAAAERFRMLAWARAFVVGSEIDPRDLVEDAILAALSGDRKCRRDLSIMVFFKSTLRSLANGEFRSAWRRHREILSADDETVFLSFEPRAADDPSHQALVGDACARLLAACAQNEDAYNVLMCRGAGYSPEETQRETGLSTIEYASALRYIRRAADRTFPEGWQ